MANQIISAVKESAQSIAAAARPWSEFLDLSALRFPSSVADVTTRVTQNLTHFRINYSIILSFHLCLALITNPIAVLAFIAVALAWYFLYFAREESIVIFGFSVNDGAVRGFLAGLTLASLVITGVFLRTLTVVGFGVLLVSFHAALRGTDDLVTDDLESPYGAMLSPVGGENGGARGDYAGL